MSNLNQGVLPPPMEQGAVMLQGFLDLIAAASTAKGRKEIEGTVSRMVEANAANKALLAEAAETLAKADAVRKEAADRETEATALCRDIDAREAALKQAQIDHAEKVVADMATVTGRETICSVDEQRNAADRTELTALRIKLDARKLSEATA